MPWVKFSADFMWHPHPAQTVAYRAGGEHLVTQACAAAAGEAGAGEILRAEEGGPPPQDKTKPASTHGRRRR